MTVGECLLFGIVSGFTLLSGWALRKHVQQCTAAENIRRRQPQFQTRKDSRPEVKIKTRTPQ